MSGTAVPSIIEFDIDLNDQEAPDPIPVGEYPAEITQASIKQSATSGNLYLAAVFRISPDAYPPDYTDGNNDGTPLSFNRIVIDPHNPQARYRLKKFIESVGGKAGRTFDPNDLIGLHGTVEIEHRDFEGEKQASIKRVIAP